VSDKRIHKKPVGDSGPVQVRNVDGNPVVTWNRIDYPAEKRAQEMLITSLFLEALNAKEMTNWSAEQLAEDDFDFIVGDGSEKRYLELQEIVILPKKRGSPYVERDQVIISRKFADTILSEISRKIAKYPKAIHQDLDLLIYNTHWRFQTNKVVVKLLAYPLKLKRHPFSCVYLYTRLAAGFGNLERIFPNDEILRGFDPVAAKNDRYVNFDPAAGRPVKQGDRIGVSFRVSPENLRKFRDGL
jgi:hypothetical protein